MEHDELPGNALDTLVAMVERGPLKSGDLPSKAGRSTLLEGGYAAQVAHTDGDWAYAATPKGVDAYIATFGGKTLDEAKLGRLFSRAATSSVALFIKSIPKENQ